MCSVSAKRVEVVPVRLSAGLQRPSVVEFEELAGLNILSSYGLIDPCDCQEGVDMYDYRRQTLQASVYSRGRCKGFGYELEDHHMLCCI